MSESGFPGSSRQLGKIATKPVRVLRDVIAAEDEPTGRLVTALTSPLTDRIKQRHNPIPRADVLKAVAHAWRHAMPPRSRLDLAIDPRRKSLAIRQMRVTSSVYRSAAWEEHERSLVIMAIVLEAWAFHYQFTTSDARSALQRMPQRFDVLVLGHVGSSVAALEIAGSLRELAHGLPILLATPSADEIGADSLMVAGITDVVPWPIVASDIAVAITACLAARRSLESERLGTVREVPGERPSRRA